MTHVTATPWERQVADDTGLLMGRQAADDTGCLSNLSRVGAADVGVFDRYFLILLLLVRIRDLHDVLLTKLKETNGLLPIRDLSVSPPF